MKQCSVCKAFYADDSLNFCLNDGSALLAAFDDEQATRVVSSRQRNTAHTDFKPDGAANENLIQNSFQPAAPLPHRNNSKTVFVLASLGALFLLVVIGGIAAFMLVPRGAVEQKNDLKASTPASNNSKDDERQKEKIADLERRIQDLKKSSKANTIPPPTNSATPLNQSGKATARVKQSSDGFLALRNEPSVQNGYQILKIPSGATVELEDCRQNFQTVAGRRGRWCMVTYAGETGWAFDGWLEY
jgi:hypothetical protein